MSTMRSAYAVAALAACLLGTAGCADLGAIDETREDRSTFPFSGTRLTVDNAGAELRVVTGAIGAIEVERSLTGKATLDGNASWSLEDPAGGSDATLRLGIVCSGFVPDCGGRHVVHVPPGVTVEITSDGAPVRVVGLTSQLSARVTDSWLRVEQPGGRLRLRAAYNVEVTGARSNEVSATSDERTVDLTFAAPPGRVEAKAGHGSISITLPAGPETYRIAAGDVKSGVPSDPASPRTITATTGDGRDIQIRKAG